MTKFKVGDRVRLIEDVNSMAGFKTGAETVVIGHIPLDPDGRHRYGKPVVETRWGALPKYMLFEDSLELAAPLSPFEESVRAYISQELSHS